MLFSETLQVVTIQTYEEETHLLLCFETKLQHDFLGLR